jgi:hypothetical protein
LPLKKTKVNKLIVEDDDLEFDKVENKVNDVFEELNKNYMLALEFSKSGTKVPRGDDSWYKHCGVVMRKLAKEYPDSREMLIDFLVAHMIETLLFHEKLDLMNYIYSLSELNNSGLSFKIKDYFERKSIATKNFNAIIMYDLNKIKIMILKNNKWIEAEPEDQKEIAETREVMDLLTLKISDYNQVVGFMGYEKNNKYIVFKTKDMLAKRDTGARCDEAGKNKTLDILNKIVGEERYTKENTKIVKDEDKNVVQEAVGHVELCVLQEFILRYFDKIRRDGKKWFFTPDMAIYHKLYTIHVK